MTEVNTILESAPPREEFKVTPIVYIFLIKDDQILLMKRNRGTYEDYWSLPAGHIEEGEKITKTAKREANEELGIEIEETDLDMVHLLHTRDSDGQRMIVSLRATRWTNEPTNMEPEKHKEIAWFSLDSLPEHMPQYTKDTIADIQNGLSFRESNWI